MTLSKVSSRSPRLWCCLALILIAFALLASVPASATPPAAFTTFDNSLQGCLDGQHPNGIDCNNYAAKADVFINGGPSGLTGLSDGTYYFVVLVPGYQNGGFIDGADGNLSDLTSGPTAGDNGTGDDVSNRTFAVAGGVLSYSGTHTLGTNPKGDRVIQLFPYDDTSNMGGVYILGICLSGATSPSECKFDAFKIKTPAPPGQPGQATISACKFWDVNLEHQYDPNTPDPFIGNWPITATITGGDSQAYLGAGGTTVTQDTDDTTVSGVPGLGFGCTTFAVTWPPTDASPTSVSLSFSEGSSADSGAPNPTYACDMVAQTCSLLPAGNWQQSAPYAFSAFGGCTAGSVCNSLDDTTVNPNDNTSIALPFGNFIGQDLTVSKTATPTFTRTYNWSISKSVDKTLVEQIGGSATFNYTVVATQTGFTDSAWQVTGTITVKNTNPFDVTSVSVSDAVDDGGTCVVTGGTNVTVPANGSTQLSYTCTYSSAPSPLSGTNTATASWTGFGTPDTSATGTAGFTFSTPTTTVNKTITVTDTYWTNLPSPTTVTLGQCTATDASPFASCTFKYSRSITVKPGCNFYDNTATISETGQYANKEVEVCGPAKTGALTLGFWQNKNGQGIITGGLSVSGVCKAGTWLRQYPPFQDLSSTASCAQVATYVYNVIKAATCSGTTQPCNAMLKAQMLATALDVYFSDSTLGGNKIGAPSAIGAQKIDLTKVCSMIDGTGGTASCSGTTFLNCSSAFGGATCLSVADILTYAGSQSNAGGSVWYANVKATQVLAKNVFDAINNQVAFNCP